MLYQAPSNMLIQLSGWSWAPWSANLLRRSCSEPPWEWTPVPSLTSAQGSPHLFAPLGREMGRARRREGRVTSRCELGYTSTTWSVIFHAQYISNVLKVIVAVVVLDWHQELYLCLRKKGSCYLHPLGSLTVLFMCGLHVSISYQQSYLHWYCIYVCILYSNVYRSDVGGGVKNEITHLLFQVLAPGGTLPVGNTNKLNWTRSTLLHYMLWHVGLF